MRRPLSFGLLAAYAFCATAVGLAAQTPTERDSAGIRIIENPARASAPLAFRLGAPTLRLGGPRDDPEDELSAQFMGRVAAIRLSDRTLAVPNDVRVLFYSADGRRTGVLGRRGAGPQEFQSLAASEFCRTRGDTIIASDYRNGRFAVIHAQRVVRTAPYMEFGGATPGCFDDGTVLRMGGLPNFKTPTYTIRLNRVRLDGSLVNSLGEMVMTSPSALTGYQHPTVLAHGQRVYVGDPGTNDIRVYRADGRVSHLIRTADPLKPLTDAEVEQAVNSQPAGTPREAARQAWRPKTHPSYSSFQIDPDGRLWVLERATGRTEVEVWTAFDTSGRLLGRLDVPRTMGPLRTSVLKFGANEVQIQGRDADGFLHIAIHPIERLSR